MTSNSARDEIYRKYLDARMAEQIRESSQELRALETKIRSAYVSKALRAQLAEREKSRLQEQLRQQNEIDEFNQNLAADEEHKRQQQAAAKVGQLKLREELQEQIVAKWRQRKLLYEEFLNEKLIIDEIMRKIQIEQIEYVFLRFFFCNYPVSMFTSMFVNAFGELQRVPTEAVAIEMVARGYRAIEM